MKKKKLNPVKIETFNTKRGKKQYIVARLHGRIDQKRPLAGTRKQGLLIEDFKNLYKNQFSLYENKKRKPLTNVTQIEILEKVKVEPIAEKTLAQISSMTKSEKMKYKQAILPANKRKPLSKQGQRGKAMYMVEGYFDGKKYSGTSKFIGASAPDGYIFPESADKYVAKESAWRSVLSQISKLTGHYDEDEGLRLVEDEGITRVKEGWMFFTGKSSRKK